MTDLVGRLRRALHDTPYTRSGSARCSHLLDERTIQDAADEIERLNRANAEYQQHCDRQEYELARLHKRDDSTRLGDLDYREAQRLKAQMEQLLAEAARKTRALVHENWSNMGGVCVWRQAFDHGPFESKCGGEYWRTSNKPPNYCEYCGGQIVVEGE